ncbi:MAG: acetylglutamate kinase, partial [Chloroflexota bacterium]
LISEVSRQGVHELIETGVVSGGMIPKVLACVRSLEGAGRAHIVDGRTPHALIRELYTDRGVGTMITP